MRVRALWLKTALLAWPLLVLAGCTREQYHQQADEEVKYLISEKSNDPRWDYSSFSIETDPRARFYDPANPDRPPLPPDDPAAAELMRCVDGKKGYPRWEQYGRIDYLESPEWREHLAEYCEITPEGRIKLGLDDAVRLALVHSPDYRNSIETLYLSALDVSAERFRFDTQFFGNTNPNFLNQGRARGGGELSTLTVPNSLQARKRFATGADLLVGFANSFVWQFSSSGSYSSSSLLNFSLVQPLLRAGGRAVALEQLTIVERALLYNLRAWERYRQGFYTRVAIGDTGVTGPQRRGGFFGGTGLTGFTGTGAGGFGEVGGTTGFGRGGFGAAGGAAGGGAGFAGGGEGTLGGYIGLLQQLQQIRNSEDSLSSFVRSLGLLEAQLEAGRIDLGQVLQLRQNIETERSNLIRARNGFANSVDTFLRSTIGLPPDVQVELDDSMIRQFQFIDPASEGVKDDLMSFVTGLSNLPDPPPAEAVSQAVQELSARRAGVGEVIQTAADDLARLEGVVPERSRMMTDDERREFEADLLQLHDTLADVRTRFEQSEAILVDLAAQTAPEDAQTTINGLTTLASGLANLTQELSLVQARSRLEAVTLQTVTLSAEEAFEIARTHRLDWMNNRAALIDTWRLITFNANALEANLDITFSGDLGTVNDHPFEFRGVNGSLRAGLRFDAPFTRLLERNNFRAVLIDYQRDRRQLIQFQDGVMQGMRQTMRELDRLAQNLEIQRRAVAIAIRRVDQEQEQLNEPPPVAQPGETPQSLGDAAALNLITAISDLRNVYNNFMGAWLNYYASRMVLMRELGLMQVDENGLWVDVSLQQALADAAGGCPLPPEVPQELFDALDAEIPPEGIQGQPALPSPQLDWKTASAFHGPESLRRLPAVR
jgi:hypothetical protein